MYDKVYGITYPYNILDKMYDIPYRISKGETDNAFISITVVLQNLAV